MAISAATQQHVRALIQRMFQTYDSLPEEAAPLVTEMPVYELPEEKVPFTVTRERDGSFRVSGRRIERAAAMTYWDKEEAVLRFQNILEVLGVSAALEDAGVQVGDTVYIGDYELEWAE